LGFGPATEDARATAEQQEAATVSHFSYLTGVGSELSNGYGQRGAESMAFELALRGEPIRTGQASPIVKTVETVKTVSVDSRCRNCQTVSPPSDFSPGPLSPAGDA